MKVKAMMICVLLCSIVVSPSQTIRNSQIDDTVQPKHISPKYFILRSKALDDSSRRIDAWREKMIEQKRQHLDSLIELYKNCLANKYNKYKKQKP